MKDPELSEALRELRDAEEVLPGAYAAVRARVMTGIAAERRLAWPWWLAGAAAATACALWMLFFRMAPPAPQSTRAGQVRPLVIAMPAEPAPAPAVPMRRKRPKRIARSAEPLQIKILTDDPDVVIYWIVDGKGE